MPNLLHIDSSPLYGRSVSRQLTGAFVTQWKSSHPDGTVIDRDLNATSIPPVTAEWVGANYTPEEARTSQQKEVLALSDTLFAELEQAARASAAPSETSSPVRARVPLMRSVLLRRQ